MNIYEIHEPSELIRGNSYVGRGIITGLSENGKKAVCAYFIMGRSENSRNRVFAVENGELCTTPHDEGKVTDPSLIIYAALRQYENRLIVTNGNQTDTVYEGFEAGKSFAEALSERAFEPDAPNFTPRISAVMNLGKKLTYSMSILKSMDEVGSMCARYTFDYAALPGLGHFLHTYVCDGSPIPSFQGEPERVRIADDIDAFTDGLWDALDSDNKISLYTRYIDLSDGTYTERLINKNR